MQTQHVWTRCGSKTSLFTFKKNIFLNVFHAFRKLRKFQRMWPKQAKSLLEILKRKFLYTQCSLAKSHISRFLFSFIRRLCSTFPPYKIGNTIRNVVSPLVTIRSISKHFEVWFSHSRPLWCTNLIGVNCLLWKFSLLRLSNCWMAINAAGIIYVEG